MRLLMVLAVLAASAGTTAAAQTDVTATPAALVNAPQQSENYVYQADGRRDPFMNLINGGGDVKAPIKREGIRTFTLDEVSVRGIMQSRDALVAMVMGPDNKTYLIHKGDKLADAVVKNVTTQGLIVMQDVSDPLSVQKQREVRKLLRSLEGTEK